MGGLTTLGLHDLMYVLYYRGSDCILDVCFVKQVNGLNMEVAELRSSHGLGLGGVCLSLGLKLEALKFSFPIEK